MNRISGKCGEKAEDPGSVTLRLIDGQLPSKWPRTDLCQACSAELDRFLTPPAAPVDPPAAADQASD